MKLALTVAAARVAEAKPKTPSALVTLVQTVLLPLLPVIIGEILKADTKGKYKKAVIKLRDWLGAADLD